jgi:hypothetical protein
VPPLTVESRSRSQDWLSRLTRGCTQEARKKHVKICHEILSNTGFAGESETEDDRRAELSALNRKLAATETAMAHAYPPTRRALQAAR